MKRFKNILCIIEDTQASQSILQRAVKLATDNQAKLTVASVINNSKASFGILKNFLDMDVKTLLKKEKTKELEDLTQTVSNQSDIEIKVFFGTPFYEIIYHVLLDNYDLVIKIPENASWMHRLFGSNDMHLLRKCPCPVWFIKKNSPESFNHIMAAVDVNIDTETEEEPDTQEKLNHQILQIASSLAVSELAQLHVLHVWDAPETALMQGAFIKMPDSEVIKYAQEMQHLHDSKLQALLRDAAHTQIGDMVKFLKPNIHLLRGLPNKIIPQFAQKLQIDLIVMGTVARTGLAGVIMGNTAEDILNQIDCSVLAVKPPGFKTPVSL
ncbi:universal stress protein [Sulfurimonas sp. ST-27]|uniref:universal stress protein n=1 Tax=Sulfurimonas sp. ST-27 TaxID=3400152 RepID=UPI003AB70CCA